MDIKIKHDIENSQFTASIENNEGQLKYRVLPDGNLDFYSTYVPDAGRGKGIAKMLVDAGVEYAKSENKKIKPSCSYVESYFKRATDLTGLLVD